MKYSKKMRLLQGVTGIRIRMGITQLTLAKYLGLSENMISMVECGKRHLSDIALAKICELELYFQQHGQAAKDLVMSMPVYHESELERTIRAGRENINRIKLGEEQYKLEFMKRRCVEITGELHHLDTILELVGQQSAGFALTSMLQSREKLLKQLKRCDAKAQAKVEGKIAMLEIIVASYEPQQMQEPEPTAEEMDVVNEEPPVLLPINLPTATEFIKAEVIPMPLHQRRRVLSCFETDASPGYKMDLVLGSTG